MTLMTAHIVFETEELQNKIKNISENFDNVVSGVFDLNAIFAEAWMKINAPWTDDTGAARSGLTARVTANGGGIHEMVLAYSVSYGIWLEVANSGRFQVLQPAIRYVAEKILSDLRHVLDGKKPTVSSSPSRVIPPVARKTARKGTVSKSGNRRGRKAYRRKKSR